MIVVVAIVVIVIAVVVLYSSSLLFGSCKAVSLHSFNNAGTVVRISFSLYSTLTLSVLKLISKKILKYSFIFSSYLIKIMISC